MELKQYALTDEKIMIDMIKDFWKDHNGEDEDDEEARADLIKWSKETSDRLYLFKEDDEVLGFAHLGSRGAGIDWLEHLYVKKIIGRKVSVLRQLNFWKRSSKNIQYQCILK